MLYFCKELEIEILRNFIFQDLCSTNNLQDPIYEETKDVGPPHARVFTIKCIVSTFAEEASATTKKQAKHEAARKMIDRISDVVSDDLIVSSAVDNEENAEEISKRIAQLKYPDLSVLHTDIIRSKTNWGLKLIDFHSNLKNRFASKLRDKIIIKLEELLSLIEQCKQGNFSISTLVPVREELKNILESLDFDYNFVEYKSVEKSVHILAAEIFTSPHIQEIGVGKSELEAECNAINNVVLALIFFLN